MRTILSVFSVLAFCGSILAADSTTVTPVPAEQPAPAEVKPAPATQMLTWSGMAMIRLREDIIKNTSASDVKMGSANYSNRLAYKLGAKVQANPQVSFMFEIGNEWYATELVNGGNTMTAPTSAAPGSKRGIYDPMFLQAWAQWDPGFLHLQVGIDPVKGSAAMDLIGMSLLFNRNYVGLGFQACQLPWGVTNNFMYPGLRIGAPILSDDVKLGVDVFSGIAEERPVALSTSAAALDNYGAILNIVDISFGVGPFTATPQFIIIVNRNFVDQGANGAIKDKSDQEIGFGSDFGYKISDMASMRLGFGMAMVSNKNTVLSNDSTLYDRQGTNITLGSSIKAGPGKIDLDFNFGTNNDKEGLNKMATYQFVDVKYGWGVVKNFIIMPRVRAYFGQVPVAGLTKKDSNIRVWPELMLFGTF
jgi:hypothetical protein